MRRFKRNPLKPSWLEQATSLTAVMIGTNQPQQLLDRISGTVITMGDSAYSDGTLNEFNDCYGPTWGRHKDRTRPSPGNHDYYVAGAAGYYAYFGEAASELESNCSSNCKGYYSYDLGPWHIIALNSEIARSAGSEQEQWLRADLAANQTSCTLAYWHKPLFSSGNHGNNSTLGALWQALYDYGADVVLKRSRSFLRKVCSAESDRSS